MEAEATNDPSALITGSFGTAPDRRRPREARGAENTSMRVYRVFGATSSASSSCQSVESSNARDPVAELFMRVDARWRSSAPGASEGTMICVTCGREGHPCCGLRYWTSLRAAWLRVPEEEVAIEPESFEDPGPLQLARADQVSTPRDLSEGELEDLEDCLDAVQGPYPPLKRSVPLIQAVQCAEALWDTDD